MSTRKTSKKAGPKKAAGKTSTRAKSVAKKKAPAKKASAKKAAPKRASAKKAAVKRAPAKKAGRRKAAASQASSKAAAKPSPLLDEVEALAEMMEKHGLLEVSYAVEADGTKELHVSRSGSGQVALPAPAAPVASAAPAAASPTPAAAAPAALPDPAAEEGLYAFTSPMVGTFYRSPSPEAAPFVSVGDKVDPNSAVCIIEAMKVMNEINPDRAGEIVSIEVENGEAVEFGQTLMLLRMR